MEREKRAPAEPEWTIAEVKAELAREGAQLDPRAMMHPYDRPETGSTFTICVVETVESVKGKPWYCVHGFASCLSCDKLCYLGSETGKAVVDRSQRVYPMCVDCARRNIPDEAQLSGHLENHARSAGSHD